MGKNNKSRYTIYKAILDKKNGFSSKDIQSKSELSPSYTYKILKDLVEEGVIGKDKDNRKITYSVLEPYAIRQLMLKESKPTWSENLNKKVSKTWKGIRKWLNSSF